ncbi:type II CAAX endopeptidase family protein [Janthinobacterium sp. SUN026]|uniref:CPBP family intramembrane glutamic endopeptidase n=1 Tax=Janthinobacterium sp. SUN026 TaxID=3002438 RepID=UPI0025B053A8|nr:type II CAAX endopeptidase family protein [Janthinobacterium sp. SUN026]MDN2674785.1 type II CAAX endopeptidase family protein [Janthinobacterium sp. SUN026]
MMDSTLSMATKKSPLARLMAYPLVQIVLGMVLTFAAVPLVMGLASQLVDKPYRILWPQLLAALLVWCGYRFYVRHIEKRQPTELAMPGMAGELGRGLLFGAGLVALTFGVLAALGVYQFSGVNALSVLLLLPLAELVLVGMAEEMMFRGILFGVTARALGNKAAIVISSLVFALAHLPNAGFSLLAIIALVAYGVLQAALYMKTRRLWVCIGTHIGWNYCVGQVFSSTVSGHAATDGLLRGELAGNAVLTGGAFGVEGSLVTVLLIGAVAAYLLRLAFASAPGTSRD